MQCQYIFQLCVEYIDDNLKKTCDLRQNYVNFSHLLGTNPGHRSLKMSTAQ
jgi:hypothetical protein